MDEFELELKQDFLLESEDLLSDAEGAFLSLEGDRNNPELLNEIFRLAHNLKGTAKAVGFDKLSVLTHTAENLILKLKEGELEVSDSIVTVLLEFKDNVAEMIAILKDDMSADLDIAEIDKKLEQAAMEEVNRESAHDVNNNFLDDQRSNGDEEEIPSESDKGFDNPLNLSEEVDGEVKPCESEESHQTMSFQAIESLRSLGYDEDSIKELEAEANNQNTTIDNGDSAQNKNIEKESGKGAQNNVVEIDNSKKNNKKNAVSSSSEVIRVKLSLISELNNIVGELVILHTVLNQRRFEYVQDPLANKTIGQMGKLFKEIQNLAMSLRMLPLKGTVQKVNRIIRDTSKKLKKKVELIVEGEETEVDKTVLESLADPLVHIFRNSVDHGIELPAERLLAGKQEVGRVEFKAFHEGSNIVIQVTDDGKGIDADQLYEKAKALGIVSQNEKLSRPNILQLIFHPGLSTKEQVTEVSGRGVGMDVVKTNIEQLGGYIELESEVGKGSTIKIILPLTLAIIEGMVIAAGSEKFVIPLREVFEIVQIKSSEVEYFTGGAELFKVRGEVLPLFHINKKLGIKKSDKEKLIIIIIKGHAHTFGIAVDDILNQQQIVIKPLGDDIKNMKGVMGSAIMGDGRPSFILDVLELFNNDLKESSGFKNLQSKSLEAMA